MKIETIEIKRITLEDGYFCDIIPVDNVYECYLFNANGRTFMFGLQDNIDKVIEIVSNIYQEYIEAEDEV